MTQAAIAAKEIRARLKQAGIIASVKSQNYSGGNSVNVSLTDATPATVKTAQSIARAFQSGSFDGMTDCYNYDNSRDDLPAQAKYVFVNNHLTDATAQKVWDYVRTHFAEGETMPASYTEARQMRFADVWVSNFVWRQWSQADSLYWHGVESHA